MFSKFLPTDCLRVKGENSNCSGNTKQYLDPEFEVNITNGSRGTQGAFKDNTLRITVTCYSGGMYQTNQVRNIL